jgi:hypothetical protein
MRTFWERLGILLPIYRLVGQGLTEGELHFLDVAFFGTQGRLELVQHACSAAQQTSGAYHLEVATHRSKIDPRSAPQDCSHKCE